MLQVGATGIEEEEGGGGELYRTPEALFKRIIQIQTFHTETSVTSAFRQIYKSKTRQQNDQNLCE
jgi:hypothetical protein